LIIDLGMALVIASTIGIISGIKRKNKPTMMLSAVKLVLTILIGVYFYNNPY